MQASFDNRTEKGSFHLGSIHGTQYTDGSICAYDYERQVWIDTGPDRCRDHSAPEGSASNPLKELPAIARDIAAALHEVTP